jgi:hypothetical protein
MAYIPLYNAQPNNLLEVNLSSHSSLAYTINLLLCVLIYIYSTYKFSKVM